MANDLIFTLPAGTRRFHVVAELILVDPITPPGEAGPPGRACQGATEQTSPEPEPPSPAAGSGPATKGNGEARRRGRPLARASAARGAKALAGLPPLRGSRRAPRAPAFALPGALSAAR